jgi:lactate dehydrogenase-like 2-hydroxyacid dehydrogenase
MLTERIDDQVLRAAPRLRIVSNMAVGVDNIDLAACTRRSLPVGHTPGVLTQATADLTLALILMAARRLPQAMSDAREGRWQTWSPTGWLGLELGGATLGIVGLGKIGRAVWRRARAFGMRVVYTSRTPKQDVDGLTHLSLDELLSCSDVVTLHVPLTSQTHKLIADDQLARMKSKALLVNTARGSIVDADALGRALSTYRIAGAALDVTDPEPLPPTHPLFSCPNLIVTPHIGSATHATRQKMAELACHNVVAALSGRPVPHCANPELYE